MAKEGLTHSPSLKPERRQEYEKDVFNNFGPGNRAFNLFGLISIFRAENGL